MPQPIQNEKKNIKVHVIALVATEKGFEGVRTENGLVRQGITQASQEDLLQVVNAAMPELKALPEGTQVVINITIEKPEGNE